MRRLTAWTLGIGFIGGLLGPDAIGAVFTALAAFVLAFALRRPPWRWGLLCVAAWASGTVVGALLTILGHGRTSVPPSQAGAGVTVLAAYASAFAGSWLNWIASRLIREQ